MSRSVPITLLLVLTISLAAASAALAVKPKADADADQKLVEKWVKVAGIDAKDTFAGRYFRYATSKGKSKKKADIERAKKIGEERDVKIANYLDANAGTQEFAAAMFQHEIKIGMTEEAIKLGHGLKIRTESDIQIRYSAAPIVYDEGREVANDDVAIEIIIDQKTKKVTFINRS